MSAIAQVSSCSVLGVASLCGDDPGTCWRFYQLVAEVLESIAAAERQEAAA
jgi:hypothetical protein